jgi:thymidine kinase
MVLTFTYGPANCGKTAGLFVLQMEKFGGVGTYLARVVLDGAQIEYDAQDRPCIWAHGESFAVDAIITPEDRTNFLDSTITPFFNDSVMPKAILIDDAHFLTACVVKKLSHFSKVHGYEIHCYGLRADIHDRPFEGSAALMAVAEKFFAKVTSCAHHPYKEATQSALRGWNRKEEAEKTEVHGARPSLYEAVCYDCWRQRRQPPGAAELSIAAEPPAGTDLWLCRHRQMGRNAPVAPDPPTKRLKGAATAAATP